MPFTRFQEFALSRAFHHGCHGGWRRVRRILLALTLTLWLPVTSWGQGGPIIESSTATGPTTGQAPGVSGQVSTVRPMTMEVIIVMLMVGAALFVVCKSSRRN